MKPFEELTRRGKARRLREVALHALDQYDLEVTDVRLLGMYTNALFRVRAADGRGVDASYVLRVCAPGWRTLTDLRSEAMWLQALDRDTDIGAPAPVDEETATKAAEHVQKGSSMVWAGDLVNAEVELKAALELDPGNVEAHRFYGLFHTWKGDKGKARSEFRKALRLAPGDVSLVVHASWPDMLGDNYDNAIEQLEKAIAMDPKFKLAYYNLGMCCLYNGIFYGRVDQYEKALQALDTANTIEGGPPPFVVDNIIVQVHAARGDDKPAMDYMSEFGPNATIYAILGDFDKAIGLLEKAYEENPRLMALIYEPPLRLLENEPRFQELERKAIEARGWN